MSADRVPADGNPGGGGAAALGAGHRPAPGGEPAPARLGAAPCAANDYHAAHARRVLASYRALLGRDLIDTRQAPHAQARALYLAPFVVLSHDTAPDPVFNYANLAAQALWEMTWQELTALPSRLSAEPAEQATRARLLASVAARGFIEDYAGVRIARGGRRFRIEGAVVWNLRDEAGRPYGQAANFARWTPLA